MKDEREREKEKSRRERERERERRERKQTYRSDLASIYIGRKHKSRVLAQMDRLIDCQGQY